MNTRQKSMFLALVTIVLIGAMPTQVSAQDRIRTTTGRVIPNDTELKAAYCMGLIGVQRQEFSRDAEELNRGVKEQPNPELAQILENGLRVVNEHLKELSDNHNRIVSFISPRRRYLDPVSLLAAAEQGQTDWETQKSASNASRCSSECGKDPSGACVEECMLQDDLSKRIFSCRDLSFLPY